MGLLRRKRTTGAPVQEWPVEVILAHIRAAFVGDIDASWVRASVVFHHNRSLLPENAEEMAAQEAASDGDQFQGLAEWIVFTLDFNDEDRVGLYMEHDPTCLIREIAPVGTFDQACNEALAWTENPAGSTGFYDLPGVYQVAVMAWLTNTPPDADEGQFAFFSRSDMDAGSPLIPLRPYPPRIKEGTASSHTDDPQWMLLPLEAMTQLCARINDDRGWGSSRPGTDAFESGTGGRPG